MSNINNNNYRKIDCRIINDSYIDCMISNDDVFTDIITEDYFAAYLNFNKKENKRIISEIGWINAIQSDKTLDNIGYTGVDNGFISYQRDRIGNDEFAELFLNSTFDLSTYEDKFFVTKIDGNSGMMVYPIESNKEYTSFKGGWYQGFFKVDGDGYQTLPHRIDDEWNFNFTLRRMDYETPSNILNKRHLNNDGMFFYIGTRAENKFWEMYKLKPEMIEHKYDDSDEFILDYDPMDSEVIKHQYHEDTPNPSNRDDRYAESCDCIDYFADGYDPYGEGCMVKKCDNEYFADDYTGIGTTVGCDCPKNDLAIDDEYIQEQMDLSKIKLEDSKGNPLGEKGFYEIETDNKFIFFNRTKDGFTTKTWSDDYTFIMTGKTDSPNINYFPYLHRAKDGYTKDNIKELEAEHSYAYNVFKDIENNALGVKINKDGSISYRFLSTNCELIEETSLPNVVKAGEWANIQIKIVKKNSTNTNVCDENYQPGKMQLFIYVDGKLKLVSKELNELNLKRLDDNAERQEGVPYSLSIGGGTQGLSERILLDYYDRTDYELPIEKYFAGSFIGDIKNFSFIPQRVNFSTFSTIYSKINF